MTQPKGRRSRYGTRLHEQRERDRDPRYVPFDKAEPYQYGVRTSGSGERIERYPTRAIAEGLARAWAISPARTAPRSADLMRRRGWNGAWETVATWTSPKIGDPGYEIEDPE